MPTSVVRSAAIRVMTPNTPRAARPSASTPKSPTSSRTNRRDATDPLRSAAIVRMSVGGSAPSSRIAWRTGAARSAASPVVRIDEKRRDRRALAIRDVELRLRDLLEAAVPDVADHADDRHPWLIGRARCEADALADRVFTGEDTGREGRVDDRPRRAHSECRRE